MKSVAVDSGHPAVLYSVFHSYANERVLSFSNGIIPTTTFFTHATNISI
ncbi:MAG: hypothetical protein ACJA0H_001329 [Francisellaceae bacterium]|jgi:hypothetical protein